MATITETALAGEWFYLEEDEPYDAASSRFYILRDGVVTSNANPDHRGHYAIKDGHAVLILSTPGELDYRIRLTSTDDAFDEATDWLQAATTYQYEEIGEAVDFFGAFVRRRAA